MAESNKKGMEKGKSRALPDEAPDGAQNPSMLSQLTTSVRGLARDALAAPSTSELHSTAAAILGSGKGQSSINGGSGGSAWAESSKSSHHQNQTSGSHALRTGHTQDHVAQSEQEFSSFLDGTNTLTAPEDSIHPSLVDPDSASGDRDAHHKLSIPFPTLSVAEQESRDGAEVSAMLSGDSREQFEAPENDIPQESYDWGLTPEATARLREITKDLLPPPPQHPGVSSQSKLNLVPKIDDVLLETNGVGWKEQWEDVLTRYADEVWGGLLPLVKQAKMEIEETKDNMPPANSSAIRRLQAILGHLGDYRSPELIARGKGI